MEALDMEQVLAWSGLALERTWHEFEQRKLRYAKPSGNIEIWFIARVGSATAGFTMRGGGRVHQLWEDDVLAEKTLESRYHK